jgi:hypothetical protein
MFSFPLPQLYSSLRHFIRQTLPDDCPTRLTNLVWMLGGLFLSRSVQLNLIARKIPVRAKKLSTVKRFSRFLDNPAVKTRAGYDPFARWIMLSAASGGALHLLIDSTKIAFDFRLILVSVAYRRRSLPLGWVWVKQTSGHRTTWMQVGLLQTVKVMLPAGLQVSLVGDCEFSRCPLIAQLRAWGWDYALREMDFQSVWWQGNGVWQRLDSLLTRPGCRWLGWVVFTHMHEQLTHLVVYWRKGEPQPWYLATNQRSVTAAVRLYRRRMWIEALFADLKRHGFDLEGSHLRSALRLGRLTLLVCLLYLWLMAMACRVQITHQTDLVDRHDRRDLSLFRLGWDFVERCLCLSDPIPLIQSLEPLFSVR